MGPEAVGELISGSGSRLINDSVLGALVIILGLALGFATYMFRKEIKAVQTQAREDLKEEKIAHIKTRDAQIEEIRLSQKIAISARESHEENVRAIENLIARIDSRFERVEGQLQTLMRLQGVER